MATITIKLEVDTSKRITNKNLKDTCSFYFESDDDQNKFLKNPKSTNEGFTVSVKANDTIVWMGQSNIKPPKGIFDETSLPAAWEVKVNIQAIVKNEGDENVDLLGTNIIRGLIPGSHIPNDDFFGNCCSAFVQDIKTDKPEEYTVYFTVGNQKGLFKIDPAIKMNSNNE